MTQLLSDKDWADYNKIINDAGDTFNKMIITWRRLVRKINDYGEDDGSDYVDIDLEVLIHYNYFRSWPISKETQGGTIDQQNLMLYINRAYLESLGYMTENNYFDFDPGNDRFIIKGDIWKASGDTDAAQAHDLPLLYLIILEREKSEKTGDNYYP